MGYFLAPAAGVIENPSNVAENGESVLWLTITPTRTFAFRSRVNASNFFQVLPPSWLHAPRTSLPLRVSRNCVGLPSSSCPSSPDPPARTHSPSLNSSQLA